MRVRRFLLTKDTHSCPQKKLYDILKALYYVGTSRLRQTHTVVSKKQFEINNKVYVPSGVAAEQAGYSIDHVSRLCRGGSIECKRIGRAWFVAEDSLEALVIANTKNTDDATDGVSEEVGAGVGDTNGREVETPSNNTTTPVSDMDASDVFDDEADEMSLMGAMEIPVVASIPTPEDVAVPSPVHHKLLAPVAVAVMMFFVSSVGYAFAKNTDTPLHAFVADNVASARSGLEEANQTLQRALTRVTAGLSARGIVAERTQTGATGDADVFGNASALYEPTPKEFSALIHGNTSPEARSAIAQVLPEVIEKTIINNPVIERIVEKHFTVVENGVSLQQLEETENELRQLIASYTTNQPVQPIENFRSLALTQRIDNLGDVDISGSRITNSSIGATSLEVSGATTFTGDVVFNGSTTLNTPLSYSDLSISGDLTVGDDLTFSTNTAGFILVADGTNFNPVALSGDAAIDATGALTIGTGAVESTQIADGTITAADLDLTDITLSDFTNDAGFGAGGGSATTTLTGDITGSGTSTIATTLAADTVESANIVNGTIVAADLDLTDITLSDFTNDAGFGAGGGSATTTLTGDIVGSGTGTIVTSIATGTVGNTELEFDTGQNLTTTSNPTFLGLTLSGVLDFASAVFSGTNPFAFEGATADDFETTVAVTDPTADRTVTFPDASGEVSLLGQTIDVSEGGTGATNAADARTNLGVDAAGTDNSTNVTLAGALDYITLVGQEITRNAIDLATDITGTLSVANGGTGATTLNDLITLGTHTTGNYLATLADSGGGIFTITGSGTEAGAATIALANDVIGNTQLEYDTGQNLTTASSPTFTNQTLSGYLATQFASDYATTGAQDDVNLGSTSAVRYTGAGTATFTGVTGGVNGRILYVHNDSASALTLSNDSGSSTAANRILTGTGSDLAVAAGSSIVMQYDATESRWRVVGGSGGGGGSFLSDSGDTATGDYSFDTNTLVIDATNNRVGIGTSTPTTTLAVAGNFTLTGSTTLNGLTYVWPSVAGAAGQTLTTDASGNLSWTTVSSATSTTSVNQVTALAEGRHTDYVTCVLMEDKTVQCWGKDNHGEVGTGSETNDKLLPQVVPLPEDAASVTSQGNSNFAVSDTTGHVYGWGYNNSGQLGIGNTTDQHYPVWAGRSLIVDSSSNALAMTATADAQLSMLEKKFGSASAKFDGSGDYISAPTDAAFDFSSSDFTIEGWFRLDDTTTQDQAIFAGVGDNRFGLMYNFGGSGTVDLWLSSNGSSWDLASQDLGTKSSWNSDQWYHFALTWDGADYEVYIDGVLDNTVTSATGLHNSSGFRLGSWGQGSYPFEGNIDEVRVSNGLARYTTAFTPPTAAFTDDANTDLLLNMENRITNITELATTQSMYHAAPVVCALKSDDTLWCWGENANGGVGNNSTTDVSVPVQVHSGVSSLGDGGAHQSICALMNDATVDCWGDNASGQVGDGTTTDKLVPTTIAITNVSKIVSTGDWGGRGSRCALKTDNTIFCWGDNDYGQLGVGDTTDRLGPTQVPGITTATDITMGGGMRASAYAVLADDTVRAWGHNNQGQLGNGNTTNQSSPVQVLDLADVSKVVIGGSAYNGTYGYSEPTACALTTAGALHCWGNNEEGQVGDGTTTDRSIPVPVEGIATVSDISAYGSSNDHHFCALTTDGRLACWGDNGEGQLGQGDVIDRYTPQYVKTINESGDITFSGTGSWTQNGSELYYTTGNVGIGTASPTTELTVSGTTQTDILQLLDADSDTNNWTIKEQSTGSLAALLAGTQLFTVTEAGNVGIGTTTPAYKLSVVGGNIYSNTNILASNTANVTCGLNEALTGFDSSGDPVCSTVSSSGGATTTINQVEALAQGNTSYDHSCVLMEDKTVQCWGYDANGQVGTGSDTANKLLPVTVPLPSDAAQVIVNTRGANFAILENGHLYAWGFNSSGQLGNGNTTDQHTPVRVGTLTNVTKVVATGDMSQNGDTVCALTSAGALHCWGFNNVGQVGNGNTTNQSSPVQIYASGVSDVIGGNGYYGTFCALQTDNTVDCWGYNAHGQLGDGSTTNRSTPVTLAFTDVAKMSSTGDYSGTNGYGHRCAVKTDGTLWCWGYNGYGQLGAGDTTNRTSPTQVAGITTATDVLTFGGDYGSTMVKLSDGTVRTFGYNGYGQLGNGNTTNQSSPVNPGLASVSKMAGTSYGSYATACVSHTGGTVSCWGYNNAGQVGDGTTTNQSTPVTLDNVSGVTDVRLQSRDGTVITSCALKSDGRLLCWGNGTNGVLGSGSTNSVYTPQYVKTLNEAGDVTFTGGGFWTQDATDLYYTTGNVGIGTASPTTELTVSGTTQTDILQLLDADSDTNNWTIKEQSTGSLAALLAGTQLFTVTEAGNVGIGTTTPAYKLSVVGGNIYSNTNILASNTANVTCGLNEALTGFDSNGDPVCAAVGNSATTTINQVLELADGTTAYDGWCVLMEDKTVSCWGYDNEGQNGTGADTGDKLFPQTVALPSTVESLVNDARHVTYAIMESGTVYAWGINGNGQIGNGNTTNQHTPAWVGQRIFNDDSSGGLTITPTGDAQLSEVEKKFGTSSAKFDGSGDYISAPTDAAFDFSGGDFTIEGWFRFDNATTQDQTLFAGVGDTRFGIAYNRGGDNALNLSLSSNGSSWDIANEVDGSKTSWNTDQWYHVALVWDGTDYKVYVDGTLDITVTSATPLHSSSGFRVGLWGTGSHYPLQGNADEIRVSNGTARYTSNFTAPSAAFTDDVNTDFLMDMENEVTGITKIATTADYTHNLDTACALTSGGGLWCWGDNAHGEVGDGTTTDRSTPVQIFTSGVADINGGGGYYGSFCATKTDGSLQCWGQNSYGKLGDGTTTNRSTPTTVSITNVSKTSATGEYSGANAMGHRCALKTDGTVWCWGYNGYGQLGLGDTTDRSAPNQVPGITTATEVLTFGARYGSTMIKLADGTIRTFGYNGYGQLGNGNTTNQSSPVNPGLSGVDLIRASGAGSYATACVVYTDDTVSCWGYNNNGQVGDGTTTTRTQPVAIDHLTGVTDLRVQNRDGSTINVCALVTDGRMKCWGANGNGQLGNGTTNVSYTPQYVKTLNEAGDVTFTGGGFWTQDATDLYYTTGNVGIGTASPTTELTVSGTTQTDILQLLDADSDTNNWTIKEQSTGSLAALLAGTQLFTVTEAGNVGIGTTTPAYKLSVVGGNIYSNTNILASNTANVTCGLNEALTGFDSSGDPVCSTVAAGSSGATTTINQVTALAQGRHSDYGTCVVMEDKSVMCWGKDDNGEIGNGTETGDKLLPQTVPLPENITTVISGVDSNFAIAETTGNVYAWGYNAAGQLGNGNTTTQHTPVRVGQTLFVDNSSNAFTVTPTADVFLSTAQAKYGSSSAEFDGTGDYLTVADTDDLDFGTGDFTVEFWLNLKAIQQENSTVIQRNSLVGKSGYADASGWNISYGSPDGVVANESLNFHANTTAVVSSANDALTTGQWHHIAVARESGTTRLFIDGALAASGADANDYTNALDLRIGQDPSYTGSDRDLNGAIDELRISKGVARYTSAFTAPSAAFADDVNTDFLMDMENDLTNVTALETTQPGYDGQNTICALKSDDTLWCWGENGNGAVGNNSTTDQTSPVQVLTGVSSIGDGGAHQSFCALMNDSTVDCWGDNSHGQVGDATTNDKLVPTTIGITNVTKIVSSGNWGNDGHRCALRNDGTVWCWGYNGFGQLGTGDTTDRSAPTQVAGITTATDITTGGGRRASMYAVLADDTVRSWGTNEDGQLGNGNTTNQSSPVSVLNLTNVSKMIIGGSDHNGTYGYTDATACALHNDGTVSCWGYNGIGQVGDGTTTTRTIPVKVSGLTSVSDISAYGRYNNHHFCALLSDGRLSCWGENSDGQLGTGDTTDRYTPQFVRTINQAGDVTFTGGGFWTQDATDLYYTTGNVGIGTASPTTELTVSGTTQTDILQLLDADSDTNNWTIKEQSTGSLAALLAGTQLFTVTEAGNVGIGTTTPAYKLSVVGGNIYSNTNILASNTANVTCGLNEALTGFDSSGNPTCETITAAGASATTTINQVSSLWQGRGDHISCVVTEDKKVYCWGNDANGELGDGTNNTDRNLPVEAILPSGASQVITNRHTTYALLENDQVYAWGYNNVGQLGNGNTTSQNTPVRVGTLTNITKVVTSENGNSSNGTACALDSSGNLSCWGYNASGQVGNGNTTDQSSPVQVLTGVSDVFGGGGSSASFCATMTADDSVRCWGNNGYGQLGDGTTTDRSTPTTVPLLTNVTKIVTEGDYNGIIFRCALRNNGTIFCWGSNDDGQLGVGDTTDRYSPVQVSGITTATDIASAGENAGSMWARLSDGTVRAWGYNNVGQLGNGNTTNQSTPVDIGLSSVSKVVVNGSYSTYGGGACALHTGGTVSCWGYNGNGQLGDGTNTNNSTPATVVGLTSISDIATGGRDADTHFCALTSTGRVKCWGANDNGELGLGHTNGYVSTPQYVKTINEAGDAVADITIGSDVTSGTAGSVLFVSASGTLAQDNANFFFDDTNNRLGLGDATPSYQLELSTDSAAKPSTNTWTITSDERIKENVLDFSDGLDTLLGIRPVTYEYNGAGGFGYDDDETHIGIIAQELQTVAPYMVGSFTGELNGASTELLNYDGHALPFILTNAVQEIATVIDLSNASTTQQAMAIDGTGNIAIGVPASTSTAGYRVYVDGDVAATSFVNTSTRDLKEDIAYLAPADEDTILEQIESINVANYRYITEDDANPLRLGLIAEEAPSEVLSVSGTGVDVYKLAAFTLAGVKAQQRQIAEIDIDLTEITDTLALEREGGLFGKILEWLEGVGIYISENAARFNNLAATSFVLGSQEQPSGITLYDKTTGEAYCLEIKDGDTVHTAGECAEESDTTEDEAPTIALIGNELAVLPLNASYSDLGATAEAHRDGLPIDISYTTYLNGSEVSDVVAIDTSTTTVHYIDYIAVYGEQAATTTRTVIVGDTEVPETRPEDKVIDWLAEIQALIEAFTGSTDSGDDTPVEEDTTEETPEESVPEEDGEEGETPTDEGTESTEDGTEEGAEDSTITEEDDDTTDGGEEEGGTEGGDTEEVTTEEEEDTTTEDTTEEETTSTETTEEDTTTEDTTATTTDSGADA